MALVHLPASQHAALPWKNGLGVSRIIASYPPAAGYDVVEWQIGETQIAADCPFSSLPQLDRLFMVIEGAGVELTSVDDSGKTRTARIAALQAPHTFRGEWKTECRLLDGQVRVFNVICRRGRASATLEFLQGASLTKAAGESVFAVHLKSLETWTLAGHGDAQSAIEPHPGPVALIRIRA